MVIFLSSFLGRPRAPDSFYKVRKQEVGQENKCYTFALGGRPRLRFLIASWVLIRLFLRTVKFAGPIVLLYPSSRWSTEALYSERKQKGINTLNTVIRQTNLCSVNPLLTLSGRNLGPDNGVSIERLLAVPNGNDNTALPGGILQCLGWTGIWMSLIRMRQS